MLEYFSSNGSVAKNLPGFEPREGQRKMSDAVATLIDDVDKEIDYLDINSRILVIEAETGIGKTLAYLLPLILSGKRVVVSTATLNLQDQIMNKEIPLVEKILGEEVAVTCIKGRQNYLCMYRWFQLRSAAQLSLVEDGYSDRIDQWLKSTETGDRAELEWLPERSSLWSKISSHSNQCLGGDCPESTHCFVNQLRKRAGSSMLLVVNHHLFFSDLALRQAGFGELLPRYEGVVFDEAHHIENVATTFFGKSFSQYQLLDLFSDIERQADIELDPSRYDRIIGTVRGVKKRTEEFASIFPEKRGKFPLSPLIEQLSSKVWKGEVDLLAIGIERLAGELHKCSEYGEGWATLEKRATELHDNLLEIAFQPEDTSQAFVHWFERRERSVALSSTPIDVAELLHRNLYSAANWVVMTSATLSSGGDFSYFRERLGLDPSVTCLRFPSPFDYSNQSLIYVPEVQFPDPTQKEYQEKACKRAWEVLMFSKGRGLVLCTSFRGMDNMAEYLEENLPYPVLVQGRGSRTALLKQFRELENSVLIAVASFWEGVDVQGESLSCVIIDKLPFEVPTDPVVQARVQAIKDKGGNPFFEFQVPRAILTLRQGVGRLMRSKNDNGVITILDVRLFTKGYGSRFRRSLPPAPIKRELEAVSCFFNPS